MKKSEVNAVLAKLNIGVTGEELNSILTIPSEYVYKASVEDNTLAVIIYQRSELEKNNGYPSIIVFIKDNDYLSLEMVERQYKYRTAKLTNIINWWFPKWKTNEVIYRLNAGDDELILNYIGVDEDKKAISALIEYQNKVCNDRYEKKIKKITDRYDEQMKVVPDIPQDFDEFIDDVALKSSRYLVYKREKKMINAYCTHCKREVSLDYAAHNELGKCPNCGTDATYKAKGKIKTLTDSEEVSIIQKITDSDGSKKLLVRWFKVLRDFRFGRYMDPITHYSEESRYFWDVDKPTYKQYAYTWFRQRKVIWNDENVILQFDSYLYNRNLDHVFDDTAWKYSAIDIMAKAERKINLQYMLYRYPNNPAIEYLIKIGLYNLANDAAYYTSELNLKEKRIKDVLCIGMEYIPQLLRMDAGVNELDVIRQCAQISVRLTDEQVNWCCKHFGTTDYSTIFKYSTPYKVIRYIDKYANRTNAAGYYRDYLRMCESLNYDMKNSFVLFPKNLKKAHDEASDLIKYKKNKEREKKYKKLIKEYISTYEMQNKKLMIVVPHKLMDIVKEGKSLHHCVGGYVDSVSEAKTVILFVRSVDNPEKSFYTMEVKDGKVIQCRGNSNADMTPEVKRFVEKFKKEKLKPLQKSA